MRQLSYGLAFLWLLASVPAGLAAESAAAKNPAVASEKKLAERKAKAAKATKPQKLKGEITAIDTKAGTLSIKGATGEKRFTTQDAARDAMEILKVGEQVRVTYSEIDGETVATSVKRFRVKSASSEPKVKKPTKGAKAQTPEPGGTKKP